MIRGNIGEATFDSNTRQIKKGVHDDQCTYDQVAGTIGERLYLLDIPNWHVVQEGARQLYLRERNYARTVDSMLYRADEES